MSKKSKKKEVDTRPILSGRVPADLFWEFKAECVKRRLQVQKVLTALLTDLQKNKYSFLDKLS